MNFKERDFIPMLFGGDINTYSVARAFYERYKVKSYTFGKFATGPSYQSRIIEYTPNPKIDAHDMVMEYLNGNTKKALELQLKYLDLIHALFCEVNPIPVKWAANMMGYQAGGLRLPLTELSAAHKELLEREMKKAGVLS